MKTLIYVLFVATATLGMACTSSSKEGATSQSALPYADSTVIKFFQRTEGWVASDGAISVSLSDGRVMWLMGDSHIDDYDSATGTIPSLFQVRNAALVQPYGDWNWRNTKTLIGEGPGIKSLFKNTPDDDYFIWPMAGIEIGDTVYVYLGNLKKHGHGMWDWGPAGRDLWGKMTLPDLKSNVVYSPLPDFNDINFGLGYVKDESKQLVYAFGNKLGAMGEGVLYVASFSMKDPNLPWSFWNGEGWSQNIDEIRSIDTVNTGIFVTKVRNKYLMITCQLSVACDQGKNIYAATSDSPTGPFSEEKLIYTITDTLDGHYPFFYTVIPHPQYINDKDELLITYCINGYEPCINTFETGRGNPDYYRPKAIRVPLKFIDPEL